MSKGARKKRLTDVSTADKVRGLFRWSPKVIDGLEEALEAVGRKRIKTEAQHGEKEKRYDVFS